MLAVDSGTANLAGLAVEYGPFLFAILFITTITVYAQRVYSQTADAEHSQTFKQYFLISFGFGLFLVMVCVAFWIFDRLDSRQYTYTVDIEDVPLTTAFYSDSACIKLVPESPMPMQTVHAIYVSPRRLLPGENLTINQSIAGALGPAPPTNTWRRVNIPADTPNVQVEYSSLKSELIPTAVPSS